MYLNAKHNWLQWSVKKWWANKVRMLNYVLIVFCAVPLAYAVEQEDHSSGHASPAEHSPNFDLQHRYNNTYDVTGIPNKSTLDISVEGSILENDDRLRVRIENAIESHNEEELMKFIDANIGGEYKRVVMLTLGEIYEKQAVSARVMALYERYILELPKDREIPRLFLKLGRMYRDAGANKTALSKFYNVLNVAINVPVDELKNYQEVSHQAQLEIADTFFEMGNYPQASRMFKRLLRLNLVEEERINILYKYAYTAYSGVDDQEAVSALTFFLEEYPHSNIAPEIRNLLSETYLRMNDPKAAMRETLALLTTELEKINSDPDVWLYWKKKTGNKLANQFYQNGNFVDALKVYQAMVNLNEKPSWNWPVYYQIGLCYERLEMKPKAKEAYREIIETDESFLEEARKDLTLVSIEQMAGWRIDRLDMDLDMEFDLNSLLSNSQS